MPIIACTTFCGALYLALRGKRYDEKVLENVYSNFYGCVYIQEMETTKKMKSQQINFNLKIQTLIW